MTPQREAVLRAVRATNHATADEIHRSVVAEAPGVGVATVYRTLGLLTQQGFVSERRLGDQGGARYDWKVGTHGHVVCSGCGAVFDADVALPDDILVDVCRQTAVEVHSYDLQFSGTCSRCRDRSGS